MIVNSLRSIFKLKYYQLALIILQVVLLLQFNLTGPLTSKINVFNTYQGLNLDFIFFNLNWIFYYLVAELLMLPKLEELMLSPNPMLQVRYPSRKRIFQEVVMTLVLAAICYNVIYFIVMVISTKFQNLNLELLLFANETLGLISFTLLLLLLGLIFNRTFSWQVGIILGIFSLGFKTNFLFMVTTPSLGAIYFELLTSVVLMVIIYFVNKKVEVV
ncbi:hypothetical protein J2Z60_001541 [Lactobacillus colini]|uniref:Uncharacterized protein n=1 Tax=Lactobacillus colini TaxID=1819254 RepID=A0ABS4MF89_9LACO|nr:hypothetical protein [Lactobacillus colini]MBP2058362.1 hypothetical protein [Lactobacillus colini]